MLLSSLLWWLIDTLAWYIIILQLYKNNKKKKITIVCWCFKHFQQVYLFIFFKPSFFSRNFSWPHPRTGVHSNLWDHLAVTVLLSHKHVKGPARHQLKPKTSVTVGACKQRAKYAASMIKLVFEQSVVRGSSTGVWDEKITRWKYNTVVHCFMFTRPNLRCHGCVAPFHVCPLQLEQRPASVTTALCIGHRKESKGK